MAQWHSERSEVRALAAAPLVWTDIDLSSIVGAQSVLVCLQVVMPTTGCYASFRANGDSADFRGFFAGGHGAHTAYQPVIDGTFRACLVVCETGPDGVVEWIASNAVNMSVTLQGWSSSYHAGAVIQTAAPPAAWTNLDLSAVVGSGPALVLLRIEETNAVAQGLAVRRPGTSYDTLPAATQGQGGAFADLAASGAAYLIVDTDNAGGIEIKRFNAGAGILEISVAAYIDAGWNVPVVGEEEVFNGALPAAWTDLDLTTSTTPAATGLPNTANVLALMYLHDIVAGAELWYARPDGDAKDWSNGGGYSGGINAATLQAGANLAGFVGQETTAGVIEHDTQFARNGQIHLAGWVDAFDGHAPVISREYPAAEAIVAQDSEIRFRLSDASGILLSTLSVTLSTLDDERTLISGGAIASAATGVVLANDVHGYDVILTPVAELADRRWTVTVEVENTDGVGLP